MGVWGQKKKKKISGYPVWLFHQLSSAFIVFQLFYYSVNCRKLIIMQMIGVCVCLGIVLELI